MVEMMGHSFVVGPDSQPSDLGFDCENDCDLLTRADEQSLLDTACAVGRQFPCRYLQDFVNLHKTHGFAIETSTWRAKNPPHRH